MNLNFCWQLGASDKRLGTRLLDDLDHADHFEMAVAWLGDGAVSKRIMKLVDDGAGGTIRVGLSGYLTAPSVLDQLYERKNERSKIFVWGTNLWLFHPKVYLLQSEQGDVLWVGSPNATDAGMSSNCEAAVRLVDPPPDVVGSVESFFAEIEGRCRPLTPDIVEAYRAEWRRGHEGRERQTSLDKKSLRPVAPVSDVMSVPLNTASWDQYYNWLLEQAKATDAKRKVQGTLDSYLDTIMTVAPILRDTPPSSFDEDTCNMALGLYAGKGSSRKDYGHLGSMRNARRLLTPFRENRDGFRDKVLAICRDSDLWQDGPTAVRGVEKLAALRSCGVGFATRIGAILRPDLLVPVNSASRRRLAKWAGFAPGHLEDARNYSDVVERIWDCSWVNSPVPDGADELEMSCWRARCALLDLFMYDKWPEPPDGVLEEQK